MLVFEKKPKSAVSEYYRTLRTNIEYSTFDIKLRTILVTSAECNEGKSTVCGNMALSFAENDKKVLLIDCDLRNPSLHKLFNISNGYGLSDVLIGSKEMNEAAISYNNNLDILISGKIPPNPAKLIESKALEHLLEVSKEKYDLIILDSSSINIVADSQILATKTDGTLLVVKKDKTKIESVKEAKKRLEKVEANLIGCVFNCVEGPSKKEYAYYNELQVAKV